MKKLINLLLVLLIALSLFGCSDNKTVNDWTDQLKEKGKIVIGTSPDYPPFENLNTNGEIEGFDVDVANYLAGILGVEIEFAAIEFDNIVTAVQMGQVDIGMSAFTYDPDRDVIFSEVYLPSAQVVLVKKDSGIDTIADLVDKTVGGQVGTTGLQCANEIEGTKEVVSFAETTIALQSVYNGNIDALVTDFGVANAYAKANDMKVLDEYLLDENMSIIIKNGNNLLAEKINEAIKEFLNAPEYQEYKDKWGL